MAQVVTRSMLSQTAEVQLERHADNGNVYGFDVDSYKESLHSRDMGRALMVTPSISSTQEFMRQHTSKLPEGTVLVAEQQVAGKGACCSYLLHCSVQRARINQPILACSAQITPQRSWKAQPCWRTMLADGSAFLNLMPRWCSLHHVQGEEAISGPPLRAASCSPR
jgi:hypothetical protein